MAVVYTCKLCGVEHEAIGSGWHSKENFDAVPPDNDFGSFGCSGKNQIPPSYKKSDMRWHSDYEGSNWEELNRLLAGYKNDRPPPERTIDEIELEMATRKFQVVARVSDSEVILGRFRTEDLGKKYLARAGLLECDDIRIERV